MVMREVPTHHSARIASPVDCVVHSHTLEHMYEPGRFLDIIRGLLEPGQLHILSSSLECWVWL